MNREDWHAHPMTEAEWKRLNGRWIWTTGPLPQAVWERNEAPEPPTEWAIVAVAIAGGIVLAILAWIAFVVIIAVWGD